MYPTISRSELTIGCNLPINQMTPKLFAQKMYEGVRSKMRELPMWEELTDEMQLQVMKDVTEALKNFASKNKGDRKNI
jgi:hypothetical protein